MQDEHEEEALERHSGVGIGWFKNPDFDRVDNQLLFDHHFHSQTTRRLQESKNIVNPHIKSCR